MALFDAHCHWQDPRLATLDWPAVVEELSVQGLRYVVVNGTHPGDWAAVQDMAHRFPKVVRPVYGVHPWRASRSDLPVGWADDLRKRLRADSQASVGEVGLDRWIEPRDEAAQEMVFRTSLAIAREHDRPVTVHCLRAWGWLLKVLREVGPPRRFLVHSVNAAPEVIAQLADMGAFFSVSGAFADEAKPKYHRALRSIPLDRLLVETDAPDMLAPAGWRRGEARDPATGKAVTHPVDLAGVYAFVGERLGLAQDELEARVAGNFARCFGPEPPAAG